MAQSILNSTKKVLGIAAEDTSFDEDVMMHINSVLAVLNRLGIGPDEGFMIEGPDETWDTFLGPGLTLNMAKSYMYVKLRLVFDSPNTSFAIDSLQKQAQEYEWRLNEIREEKSWQDPTPAPEPITSSWW